MAKPVIDHERRAKTPLAVRAMLRRRPGWLRAFGRGWLAAAAGFDPAVLGGVVGR
ncbi:MULTISPECIES: hypothetical protein [Streptomyces]|uniref:hypothetical protein n=1 Tax=Streptomyces TaxID=1883 RepID=UPI000AECFBC3|nr:MULTISPECIES: hypothetical protein [Streptomyces]